MAVRSFVLGVILLAAVGWCMVQESYKQTRARYRLAELSRREEELRKTLRRLRAEEEGLRSPARLAVLVREKNMPLAALGAAVPGDAALNGGGGAEKRLPGDVSDKGFSGIGRRVKVAAATSR